MFYEDVKFMKLETTATYKRNCKRKITSSLIQSIRQSSNTRAPSTPPIITQSYDSWVLRENTTRLTNVNKHTPSRPQREQLCVRLVGTIRFNKSLLLGLRFLTWAKKENSMLNPRLISTSCLYFQPGNRAELKWAESSYYLNLVQLPGGFDYVPKIQILSNIIN